jgi:hypothetical protein
MTCSEISPTTYPEGNRVLEEFKQESYMLIFVFFESHSSNHLRQGSPNYDPQAKCNPLSVFTNKVLLEHSP